MLVHISFCMLKDIDNFLIKKKDNSAVRMNTIEKNDINILIIIFIKLQTILRIDRLNALDNKTIWKQEN